MKRAPRPAFVVTVSFASVTGCAKDAATSIAAAPSGGVPTREHSVMRNPTAQGGQVRLAADGSCFVYKPFGPLEPGEQRPPGTEPPRAPVPCPNGFADDPAYKACIAGVVMATADGADCECAIGGNPPPLPRSVVCPE